MTTNVDYSKIYCLATGKVIAEISDDELGLILNSFDDIEDLSEREAALTRLTLGSMRPSLPWMSINSTRCERMRRLAPKELLAYLLNRMYAPIEQPKQSRLQDTESYFRAKRDRIAMWQLIESMNFAEHQLDQVLMVLLELDSSFNLGLLVKPIYLPSVWVLSDSINIKAYLEALSDWRDALMEKHLKAVREARASNTFWANGNRHTGKAAYHAFMETKPLTPRKAKIEAKKKEQSLFDSILANMFAEAGEAPIAKQAHADYKPIETRQASFKAAINVQPMNTLRKGVPFKFGVKSNG